MCREGWGGQSGSGVSARPGQCGLGKHVEPSSVDT